MGSSSLAGIELHHVFVEFKNYDARKNGATRKNAKKYQIMDGFVHSGNNVSYEYNGYSVSDACTIGR